MLEDEIGVPRAGGAPEEEINDEATGEDLDEETRGPEDKVSEARGRVHRDLVEELDALGETSAPEVRGKGPEDERDVAG